MKNVRKIPWGKLALQALYLNVSIYWHIFIGPAFKQAYEQMRGNATTAFSIIIETPLVIIGGCCMFALFLWAWEYNRLDNQLIHVLTNLLPLIWFCIYLYEIFTPISLPQFPLTR